jgi:hypothetical protein
MNLRHLRIFFTCQYGIFGIPNRLYDAGTESSASSNSSLRAGTTYQYGENQEAGITFWELGDQK